MGGRPVPGLLPGSFSPGAAEAGLPGTEEGASWLQALGLTNSYTRWMPRERACLRGGPEVPGEKQSHFLTSLAEMVCDLPWGPSGHTEAQEAPHRQGIGGEVAHRNAGVPHALIPRAWLEGGAGTG